MRSYTSFWLSWEGIFERYPSYHLNAIQYLNFGRLIEFSALSGGNFTGVRYSAPGGIC